MTCEHPETYKDEGEEEGHEFCCCKSST